MFVALQAPIATAIIIATVAPITTLLVFRVVWRLLLLLLCPLSPILRRRAPSTLSFFMRRHLAAIMSLSKAAVKRRPAASPCVSAARKQLRCGQDPVKAVVSRILRSLPVEDLTHLKNKVRRMRVLPVASGCSGSNVAAVMGHIVMDLLGEGAKQVDLFACEQDHTHKLGLHMNKLLGWSPLHIMLVCHILYAPRGAAREITELARGPS